MALSPGQPLRSLDSSDVDDEQQSSLLSAEEMLNTPEGELALLASLIQFRPVGLSRHWAMLGIIKSVQSRLRCSVTAELIWRKLGTLYDLEQLEEDVSLSLPSVENG